MRRFSMLIAGVVCTFTACTPDAQEDILANTPEADILATAMEFGALPMDADQGGMQSARDRDRAELGRLLFYDPILSGEKDVSCATCHHPDFGYSDGRDLPIGVGGRGLGPSRFDAINDDIGIVGRNSPTVINTAFNGIDRNGNFNPQQAPMFWDNRANSLEEQALGPPHSLEEMRGHAYSEAATLDSVVARLRANQEYRNLFRRAFGGNNSVTAENMSIAIADFERLIVAPNAPFDQFVRGDNNAMTDQQKRGLLSFVEAGCQTCHSGPMFSDWVPHAIGVAEHPDRDAPDGGFQGTFAFRTPTLRNLRYTAPYFHNGIAANLEQVMGHYIAAQEAAQEGGAPSFNPNVPQLDILLAQQQLRENQVDDIIAFMDALNDEDFDRTIPNRVPSGLPVGGLIQGPL